MNPPKLAIFDSIQQVPGPTWDRLVEKGSVFLQRRYLEALENSRPDRMDFRYVIACRGSVPASAAVFQVLKPSSMRLAPRVVICGNAFASGEHGFIHSEEIEPALAFEGLAEAAYRIRRSEKLRGRIGGVLIKDFYPPGFGGSRELRRFDYREFRVDPNMILEISEDWGDFDGYLGSLTSRYRKRAKAAFRQASALGRRSLEAGEIRERRDEFHRMYLAVREKADFRLGRLSPAYFPALKEALGDGLEFTEYMAGGRAVGFSTSIFHRGTMEAHFVGLDYAMNREHGVYLNMLYDFVRLGIERKAERIVFGRTALEVKSALGARPREMICHFRHGNPLANGLIRPLAGYIKPRPWRRHDPLVLAR